MFRFQQDTWNYYGILKKERGSQSILYKLPNYIAFQYAINYLETISFWIVNILTDS